MSQASIAHEAPLEVLRQSPETVIELMRAFGFDFEASSTARAVDTDLTETIPSSRAADFVALIRGAKGTPTAAVIVEVQLAPDPDKSKEWPRYITHVQSRHGVPATLIVLSPHRSVARWVARLPPFSPSLTLKPRVIGPDEIVRIFEDSQAPLTSPLAILAALADLTDVGRRAGDVADAGTIGVRVFEALANSAPTEEQFLRLSLLHAAASDVFQGKLNEIWEAASMDIRQLIRDEGERSGIEKGMAVGLEKGIEKGIEKGKAEGSAVAVLRILAAREISVDEAARKRIQDQRDLATLDRWLVNALTATVADDVFR